MNVLQPYLVGPATILDHNIAPEVTDYWAPATSYTAGERVILEAADVIYESASEGNLGNDPASDDGTNWFAVGATNLWRLFDQKITDQTSNAGTIEVELAITRLVTAVAFFNLGASQVTVTVLDDASPQVEVFSRTRELVDDDDIVDWWTFFTNDLDVFFTDSLIEGLAAYPGYTLRIVIGDGTGTPSCGQIAFGKAVNLGRTRPGSSIGLTSFSTKEQDDWGNWVIVPRAKSDPMDVEFSIPADHARRTKRLLEALRDVPAVYYADADLVETHGAITYGFFQDFEIPLHKVGISIVQLELEGLV
jgi:hypothetical protein